MGRRGPERRVQVPELVELGQELRVTCRQCGHRRRIAATFMTKILEAKGRSQDLQLVGDVLRCSMCEARSPVVEAMPIADDRTLARERRMTRS